MIMTKRKSSGPRRKSVKIKRSGHPRNSMGFQSRQYLRKANNLLEKGKHAEAALTFQRIAINAKDQKLKQAPWIFIRSAQAFILSGQIDNGFSLIQKALKLFADTDNWSAFQKSKTLINEQLMNSFGLPKQGDKLRECIDLSFPEFTDKRLPEPKINLPLKCDQCFATIIPIETEVLGDNKCACAFCGNLL